ncbi:vWA domain-containing protein [Tundrisphaera lichenicola]|uniref:vWA domain-containing protein n=1 Tax=Tundrisphaera lichenicola TaxID=2029860 RepID=UPI003EBDCB98
MGFGPIQFITPLSPMLWAVLAGVPVGIIALYFLKLRRRPVQVPSTLLWRRSLEDLHVNSLFQRLRKNLLLFLQLLAVFLVMLALAGPRIRGTSTLGERYVLAIDNSASMGATDVEPSRLAKAKEEARKIVNAMGSDDLAMVVSFSDRAKVVSNYTSNRTLLLQRIESITPTEATTSLREALQVAAGLANPSKQAEGVAANSIVPPKLKIYTDGGFADVEGFSLGNLEPEVVVIGTAPPAPPQDASAAVKAEARTKPPSNNVAILALQTRRNEERPDVYQVFGRVHNYKPEDVEVKAQLFKRDPAKSGDPGRLIDAIGLTIGKQADQSFNFDLPDTGVAELEVRLDAQDDLPLDNRAFTLIGSPRKAQILVVSEGNRYLVDTLRTPLAAERADVIVASPDDYKTEAYQRDAAAGRFDLIIYDRFRPEKSPEANTLYFGALPPGPAYENSKMVDNPTILDVDASQPLMQYIRDLSVVRVSKAIIVEPPPGSSVLFESDSGPLAFIAPRSGFSDAIVAFDLIREKSFNTDWVTKYSFPLFLFNAIQTLGNARESAGEEVHVPGQAVVLRTENPPQSMTIVDPNGKESAPIPRTPQGTFLYNDANLTGIYHARWQPEGSQSFAVNQFDSRESDLAPRGLVPEGTPPDQADAYKIKIGYNPVAGTRKTIQAPHDWWKPLAAIALGVVCLEWYIYNRRVYI